MRIMVRLEWSKNHISMWMTINNMTHSLCNIVYCFISNGLLAKVWGLMNTRCSWMGARCDGNFLALTMEKVNASLNCSQFIWCIYIYIYIWIKYYNWLISTTTSYVENYNSGSICYLIVIIVIIKIKLLIVLA